MLKSTNYYQREDCNSANQRVRRARQVHQALPVHLDRGEKKEPEDEGDRKGEPETKEIKVLWDHLERVVSRASWDLGDHRVNLDPKDKKEIRDFQEYQELKENLVNPFQPLLLLFLPKIWQLTKKEQPRFSVQSVVIPSLQ